MTKKTIVRWVVLFLVVGLVGGVLCALKYRNVRERNGCLNNMRQITAGVYATGLEKKLSDGAVVPVEDFVPYLKNGLPICPSGGRYAIPVMGDEAKCSVHGALKDAENAQHASAP